MKKLDFEIRYHAHQETPWSDSIKTVIGLSLEEIVTKLKEVCQAIDKINNELELHRDQIDYIHAFLVKREKENNNVR